MVTIRNETFIAVLWVVDLKTAETEVSDQTETPLVKQ